MILNIKVIELANLHSADVTADIISEVESLFREIKEIFELPLKCAIHLMGSLSYLENYIPIDTYTSFHKLISFIIASYEK